MKISILGTNGFLSTAIARYANRNGWELEMYGLNEPSQVKCNKFTKINLLDGCMDCSSLLGSDIIVYAIGAGIQSNLKESKTLIYSLNVTKPVEICNKLRDLDYTGTIITFGSVFEVGESTDRHPFTETEILNSKDPAPNDYAVSKRMLSKFVSSYKHDFRHWHFYIPTIYGNGENPQRLIPYVVRAIKDGDELRITSGNQVRQYIHVSEIGGIIKLAFEKSLPSGLYNIQGNETLTVREIVELIHHRFNKNIKENCFGKVDRADTGMQYLALDGTKLYNIIGFEPHITITDAIYEY